MTQIGNVTYHDTHRGQFFWRTFGVFDGTIRHKIRGLWRNFDGLLPGVKTWVLQMTAALELKYFINLSINFLIIFLINNFRI